jgi:hypothetical protein
LESFGVLYILVLTCPSTDKAKNPTSIISVKKNIENLSIESEQSEWRRGEVIELRARGLTYAEIARELQVPKTSVAEDMLYLRKQAKESIREYVTEQLPEQYQISLRAFILKHANEILQTTHDNREKLQAMQLFKDTHLVKPELLSSATTIDSALSCIRNKQQQEQQQKKHLALDSTIDDGNNENIIDNGDSQLSKEDSQTVF